jgi:4'-phosphopantetheinyl transferase
LIYILYTSINKDNHKRLIDDFLPKCSIEFQDKIRRYRRWQDAQLSLLGRVLLAKGVEQMNCTFDESELKYTSFNKPYFVNNGIHFNISHSGEVAICALTHLGDVGIDIEKTEATKVLDFKSQMTSNEWELVNESKDSKLSFFNYWTQKEAVIKAHGNGLSIPLKSFEVQNNRTVIGSDNFFLKEIIIKDDYCCHLALKKSLDTIEIRIKKITL